MKKEEALRIITVCAKEYHMHLQNNNLLFIFGTSEKAQSFEVKFLDSNFKHLTGVFLHNNVDAGSSKFLQMCLTGKLSCDDFSFSTNGTTELKIMVLPQLMQIHKCAKMVGEFNFTQPMLVTEKLAGTVAACMGFVKADKYYIPNTALKVDIRDITIKPQSRVLAILRKPIREKQYTEVTYLAKDISLDIPEIASIVNEVNKSLNIEKPPERKSLEQHLREAKKQTLSTTEQHQNRKIEKNAPTR